MGGRRRRRQRCTQVPRPSTATKKVLDVLGDSFVRDYTVGNIRRISWASFRADSPPCDEAVANYEPDMKKVKKRKNDEAKYINNVYHSFSSEGRLPVSSSSSLKCLFFFSLTKVGAVTHRPWTLNK